MQLIKHTGKRGSPMYKVISLFCGCGGADLGLIGDFNYLDHLYQKTGFEILHASDINAKAINTYNLNFEHKAITDDVRNLNFERGIADLVIGGFPCQNFSSVNPNKEPDKKENQLFWELARIVEEVKPKVFIGENVKGFVKLHQGKYFNLAKNEFERIGYKVYWKILNASDYGVPQLRERMIMVGIRNDIDVEFDFPEPLHGEYGTLNKEKIPLKKVIKSLIPENEKYYFSKRAVEGVKKAKNNMKRALAQDLNKPCLTITSHLAKVSLNSRDPVLLVDAKKELYRRFTPQEAALIQSFPKDFCFMGSEGDAYRQIGNAVPPVLMWHIAQSVIKVLDTNKVRKIKQNKKVTPICIHTQKREPAMC